MSLIVSCTRESRLASYPGLTYITYTKTTYKTLLISFCICRRAYDGVPGVLTEGSSPPISGSVEARFSLLDGKIQTVKVVSIWSQIFHQHTVVFLLRCLHFIFRPKQLYIYIPVEDKQRSKCCTFLRKMLWFFHLLKVPCLRATQETTLSKPKMILVWVRDKRESCKL